MKSESRKMKVTLVPFAGLGNRLNAISSAIALQCAIHCEVSVYWMSSADCRCQWEDLFLPIEGITIRPLRQFTLIRRGWEFLGLPQLLRLFLFDGCFKARKILDSDFLLRPDCPYKNIYVDANKRFCPLQESSMLCRYYQPTPELEQRIGRVTSQFGDFTIGVHVRRTDHRTVIAANPLNGFVRLMREQEQQHPGCTFYLASDDVEVKRYMEQQFPGRIVTKADVVLQRDSVEGMKDAVVELFLLARTNLIIGSRGSTYSDVASQLYDTPLVFLDEKKL